MHVLLNLDIMLALNVTVCRENVPSQAFMNNINNKFNNKEKKSCHSWGDARAGPYW